MIAATCQSKMFEGAPRLHRRGPERAHKPPPKSAPRRGFSRVLKTARPGRVERLARLRPLSFSSLSGITSATVRPCAPRLTGRLGQRLCAPGLSPGMAFVGVAFQRGGARFERRAKKSIGPRPRSCEAKVSRNFGRWLPEKVRAAAGSDLLCRARRLRLCSGPKRHGTTGEHG